jgi:hypothetical protein
VRQPLVLGVQRLPFALGRRQLVELADLSGQALAFALQRALGLAGVGQREV